MSASAASLLSFSATAGVMWTTASCHSTSAPHGKVFFSPKINEFQKIPTPIFPKRRFHVTKSVIAERPPSGTLTKRSNFNGGGGGGGLRRREEEEEEEKAEIRASLRAVEAQVYNVTELDNYYSQRPLEVLSRLTQIVFTLGSVALSIALDRLRSPSPSPSSPSSRASPAPPSATSALRAKQLRKALSSLGPTFVKLGQALSTRPDLMPPVYLEELSLLQDQLETFPDKEAFFLIESQLGIKLENIFSEISPQPIAAASLGQVYKGVLKKNGNIVAIKVQRPGIPGMIGKDFFLLRKTCLLVDKYVDSLTTNITALLDDFATRVYQELNYVQEARNARRFLKLYGENSEIVVPIAYWDYTSTKVLVMEWVEGTKLSDGVQMAQNGLDVIKLVDIGIQCSLRQLLEHGYFHADPHPGNLLATADGKLAFLDFGMMSETPQNARLAIIGHVVHLVNRDYEAMARDYYALDFLEPDVDVTPIVPALKNFFDDVLTQSVSELNFKTIVDGLGAVLYQYPFNVPAYYALILRSLTVLEGLALYTDPNFKVLAAAYPYMAKRLLTDSNEYLRDALIELLFKDGTFRWNRLENLLTQGRKDRDYETTAALLPLADLLLGPEGGPLRKLVQSEAVRVMEALLLGGAIEASENLPLPLRVFPPSLGMRGVEREEVVELRETVIRCWRLMQNSRGFDPSALQPLVEVLGKAEAQEMGSEIANGVLQRLAARSLQLALRPNASQNTPVTSPA